ncbi:proline-rich extensin-like family protein [Anaeramoeba flamelloides]|uniref:Proline-rich extensin-like family protein n=1 Tax=Anaeramoeba flamelloides TaxID=1746091 RepID=A0ABQ8YWH7_9EUKA|nr:proline-rich extensin-like family protein [Anaeramoeba flamelloides]
MSTKGTKEKTKTDPKDLTNENKTKTKTKNKQKQPNKEQLFKEFRSMEGFNDFCELLFDDSYNLSDKIQEMYLSDNQKIRKLAKRVLKYPRIFSTFFAILYQEQQVVKIQKDQKDRELQEKKIKEIKEQQNKFQNEKKVKLDQLRQLKHKIAQLQKEKYNQEREREQELNKQKKRDLNKFDNKTTTFTKIPPPPQKNSFSFGTIPPPPKNNVFSLKTIPPPPQKNSFSFGTMPPPPKNMLETKQTTNKKKIRKETSNNNQIETTTLSKTQDFENYLTEIENKTKEIQSKVNTTISLNNEKFKLLDELMKNRMNEKIRVDEQKKEQEFDESLIQTLIEFGVPKENTKVLLQRSNGDVGVAANIFYSEY